MSSARSVASARAKRAGAPDIKPNYTSIQSNTIQTNNLQSQNNGDKLSISHAITLITLRLGKIETYIQKLETEILPLVFDSSTTNNSFPTNSIQNNITIKPLEDKINFILGKINTLESENLLLRNKLQVLELQPNQSINKDDLTLNSTNIDKEELLNVHILPLTNEITKIKDLVLYLQHNSIEINQKLIQILFSESNSNDLNSEEIILTEEEELTEEIEETNPILEINQMLEIIEEHSEI